METNRSPMPQTTETLPLLRGFLEQSGLSETEALRLMQEAVDRRQQVMGRARQVVAAIEAIGDERFTIEALRSNPEAMRMIEEGAAVGEVYRKYFLRPFDQPAQERSANLGLGLWDGALTPEEIERISQYVSTTGNRYEPN